MVEGLPHVKPGLDVLARKHLAEINEALAKHNNALIECDNAERCSNNMDAQRTELEEIRILLKQYKATYFPDAK